MATHDGGAGEKPHPQSEIDELPNLRRGDDGKHYKPGSRGAEEAQVWEEMLKSPDYNPLDK
jgi:hypothetical protein